MPASRWSLQFAARSSRAVSSRSARERCSDQKPSVASFSSRPAPMRGKPETLERAFVTWILLATGKSRRVGERPPAARQLYKGGFWGRRERISGAGHRDERPRGLNLRGDRL